MPTSTPNVEIEKSVGKESAPTDFFLAYHLNSFWILPEVNHIHKNLNNNEKDSVHHLDVVLRAGNNSSRAIAHAVVV